MPQPLPDYVPSPVREIILSKYPDRGMRGLAGEVGCSYTAVIQSFKRNNHSRLRAFLDVADQLDITPERLASVLALNPLERRASLLKLARCKGDVKDLEVDSRARSYIYGLISGKCGSQIATTYIPLCRALRLSLQELYEALARPRH